MGGAVREIRRECGKGRFSFAFGFLREITSGHERPMTKTETEMPPEEKTEPLAVTISEARRLTGLGTTSIYSLIKRGKLITCRAADVDRTLILYSSLKALLMPAPVAVLPPPRRPRGRPRNSTRDASQSRAARLPPRSGS